MPTERLEPDDRDPERRQTSSGELRRALCRIQSLREIAASFGDPTATTDLSLCVVDGAGESERALVEVTVPAGGECSGVACWKATRRGFRFRDAGASEGVRLVRLITGAEGSRVEVKAGNLAGTSELPVPVKVRLVRHDAATCFEAVLGPARGTALEQ